MNNLMPAVLLSVRPQWCELIASGKKTIEVRKNRPKIPTPFKCYIYQTKPKDILLEILKDGDENYGEIYHGKPVFIKTYGEGYWTGRNQKVIGEFVCDCIPAMQNIITGEWFLDTLTAACLTPSELDAYSGGKTLYGWHISALQIYDKPRELSEFWVERDTTTDYPQLTRLKHPPQSWCYIEAVSGKDEALGDCL